MSNNIIRVLLGVGVGAAIGGTVAHILSLRDKKLLEDAEYKSYRDQIKSLEKELDIYKSKDSNVSTKPEGETVATDILGDKVVSEDIVDEPEGEIGTDGDDDIYVEDSPEVIRFISPKDYEDDDDYIKETLKYYKDGVVTQDDEVLDDIEVDNAIGEIALNCFGKFGAQPNEVYVRNEHWETDYRVKKYNISYEQYIKSKKDY